MLPNWPPAACSASRPYLQAATGWAGCWFREHEVPGGENRFGPCVPDGFPSPTQQWPLTAREPRVMVLGGSSVFVGRDKPWPHFPDVLDQRLTGIRVLNGGVPGVNSAGVRSGSGPPRA